MSPRHYSEDDLTLYYYGEGRGRHDVEQHLQTCSSCAALYRDISGTLGMIAVPEAPERGDQYGLEVWQRIRHRLPEQDVAGLGWMDRFAWLPAMRWNLTAVAAAAVLVLAAFVAGRFWSTPAQPSGAIVGPGPATSIGAAASATDTRQRILLASVADHLDRSERVLTDIMNASAGGAGKFDDISAEQRWAEDLVTTSRLYRQDATDAGEQSVAAVLDDLERSLLEIVHSPSKISAADLEQIRRRIDAAALLFKVRVMSDELRQRESAPSGRQPANTSTSKIS